jgi:hypothetical protein
MGKTIRFAAASLLALGACGSKHDASSIGSGSANASGSASAPAPAPADPAPAPVAAHEPADAGQDLHGVTLTTEGDHTAVVDTVGGFRLDMPGTPEVETDKVGAGVHVSISTDDGVLGFKIKRLDLDDPKKVDLPKVYKAGAAGLADSGFEVTDEGAITLGGAPAWHFMGTKTFQGQRITVRDWMIEIPATQTLYQIIISTPAEAPSPPEWQAVIDSFRPNK